MTMTTMQRRMFTTNVTKSAYVLTAGRYTMATLATALSVTVGVANEYIFNLGPILGGMSRTRARGVELQAVAVGANDVTTGFRAWQVKRGVTQGDSVPSADFEIAYLGQIDNTHSTAVGATSGVLVDAAERLADTLVLTRGTAASSPKGIADIVDAIYGAPVSQIFSPANNTPGRFWLTDVGVGDVLIEPIVVSATSVNIIAEGII